MMVHLVSINFDSDDPAFSGEMIMEITLGAQDNSTRVTFTFRNILTGIRPEDNETGTKLTLGKLARYVE